MTRESRLGHEFLRVEILQLNLFFRFDSFVLVVDFRFISVEYNHQMSHPIDHSHCR